ncbi:MAG: sigma-54-dependent Fis family transcriptional regulator [candidate division NC10 bacterium]|nr:sigma-54-dependent Fis family transcriptional regulator [candidate division NC10 bacterium]
MLKERILAVDDEENLLHFLSKLLKGEGYRVEVARAGGEALERAKEADFDLAILDLKLPDMDGMAVLRAFREMAPEANVVMITAYGSIESAVEAMKAGAYDYIVKPFRAEEILKAVEKALEQRRLRREVQHLRREVERRYSFENIVGKSKAMQEVFCQIERVAASKSTVLITGESGTGKELAARAIHYRSERKNGPFVVIDCGAIPENLQENELFGHIKGSFTGAVSTKRGLFEEADGGSLFLDEVGDLSGPSQAKLLRALQEGTIRRVGETRTIQVDVRVIAATNKDLAELVREGRFREDLYYRLNVVPIHLPPLRERTEDIPLLAGFFLRRYGAEFGKPVRRISPSAMDLLFSYPWPGNVRELENVIERMVLFSEGEVIGEDLLPQEVGLQGDAIRLQVPEAPLCLKEAVEKMSQDVEKGLIERALGRTGGNRSGAARLLGISRRALLYKMKAYGIT